MKSQNFLVLTFDNESQAIEGSHRLQNLASQGDISLGYNIMLKKGEDGKIEAMKKITEGGVTTWKGMFIGMLVGLFLGPFGFLISMLAGTAIGAGMDASNTNFEDNFVDSVKADLHAGKVAIIARCDEPSPAFVNDAMKDLNADIKRTVAHSGKK